MCIFLGYSAHHKGCRCLDLSTNRVIISRHVIFDETAFPFAERDGSRQASDFEFLDATDVVPASIESMHKVFPAGSSLDALPACPDVTAADSSVVPPGASEPLASSSGFSARALYVPPVRRAPGTLSPAQRTAPSDVAGTTISTSTAPRGPPPGFPPQAAAPAFAPPPCEITRVYSRRPRAPAPAPDGPPILPKGIVAVPLVSNEHSMAMHVKTGYRMPARPILHVAAVSHPEHLP